MVELPDLEVLQSWLQSRDGFQDVQVNGIQRAEGGASNLTCKVDVAGSPWASLAVRVQQDEGIFAPYDVLLEGEVIRRLQPSDIPVPEILGAESDVTVLGAPFLLMEWIDAPHMGIAGPEADFEAYVKMVVSIHKTDWQSLGLDILPVPNSPKEATLAQLQRMADRMERFECHSDAGLVAALEHLRDHVPDDGAISFCQGDINVFNYLFRDRHVVGVVDWEEAFIGDRRADIGQLIALSHLKGAPYRKAEDADFARAYAALSGEQLENLGYFRSMWFFYLAVIWHGWTKLGGGEPWYTLREVTEALERSAADY